MQTTIAILCHDVEQAIKAHKTYKNCSGHLIFVFTKEIEKKELDWLHYPHSHICLQHFDKLKNSVDLFVRFGVLYSSSWNLIYVNGKKLATQDAIFEIIGNLNEEPFCTKNNIMAFTREYALLNGIPSYQVSASSVEDFMDYKKNGILNEENISILSDFIYTDSAFLSIKPDNQEYTELVLLMQSLFQSVTTVHPAKTIVTYELNDFEQTQNLVEGNGILMDCSKNKEYCVPGAKPFKTFNYKNVLWVSLYAIKE